MTKEKNTLIPKDPIRNHPQQLLNDNVSIYDIENPSGTDQWEDLLLTCILQNVSVRTESMPPGNKRNRWLSVHRQGEQSEAEKCIHAIEYEKTYDAVPQTWIIKPLKMFKISDNVIEFFTEATKNWKVKLTAGGKSLTEMKIQRGIFQRDAPSPLLLAIAMMILNHIFKKFTGGKKFTKSQKRLITWCTWITSICL